VDDIATQPAGIFEISANANYSCNFSVKAKEIIRWIVTTVHSIFEESNAWWKPNRTGQKYINSPLLWTQ